MSVVHCLLPKAGLGNQLFPLMKAYTFGVLNNLPVIVTGYHQVKIGPYLRREKTKRNYHNNFSFEKSIWGEWLDRRRVRDINFKIIGESPLERIVNLEENVIYRYSQLPHWTDLFAGLREHRTLVKEILTNKLGEKIKKKVQELKSPCIGVHIRMGDFKKLKEGEDFRKVGATRTEESYFIEKINQIRQINGSCLPVAVFTDGYRSEFSQLFNLPEVKLVEGNPDIVDLIHLSKSKVIVASANSTFSYWAGFLSEAPIILHPDHLHAALRPANINTTSYEGPIPHNHLPALLVQNIQSILFEQNKTS